MSNEKLIVSNLKSGRYLTFNLDNEIYAIGVDLINGIDRIKDITPVPMTADYISGVINLRGKIVPALNLRRRFSLEDKKYTKETCFIFTETNIGSVALIVDFVNDVIDLSTEQMEQTPHLGDAQTQKMIIGMAKYNNTVLAIIDVNEIISGMTETEVKVLELNTNKSAA